MGEFSRSSSTQSIAATRSRSEDVNTTSLTSFPDPAGPTSSSSSANSSSSNTNQTESRDIHHSRRISQHEQLTSLLAGAGPSLFDNDDNQHALKANEPQALSAAPDHVVQGIINHYGAVELVRRLSSLLAERDAHITALTRLAEEYHAPHERVAETAVRVRQAERRKASLKLAQEDQLESGGGKALLPSPVVGASRAESIAESIRSNSSGTVRGLTKLFGGTGRGSMTKPMSISSVETSRAPSIASRAESQKPKARERFTSIDAASNDSLSWTTSLFSVGSINKKSESKAPVELNIRHDPEQLPPTLVRQETENPHEIEWNRFIVRIAELRQQHGEMTESNTMIGAAYFGREGSVGRQKLEKLTRLVIGGIPMHLRHPLWMELSNANSLATPDAYGYYLSQREGGDTTQIDSILKDIPRTLTDSYDFYANKGFERLKRVLMAFVAKYFELGYTQGLNYIAGYLLLAIPEEEEAFWVLCKMVDDFFPPEYFAPKTSMCGALADNIVLRHYIQELLPHLAKHLDRLDIPPDHTVNPGWWLTALANMLPPTMLLRVWDVMLCLQHQSTFIFNVVLTLLSQNQERLLQCESDSEYWSFQYEIPDQHSLMDRFLRQAFMLGKKLEKVRYMRRAEVHKIIAERLDGRDGAQSGIAVEGNREVEAQSIRKSASTEALYPDDERGA
ncbi:TBC-domain-containing protein [Polychaeton citri CBS 116435]|uniref:TBC-domain-containing protein n=1 Tax=Polychaeton citri CBS 116435 TaxID=1314669 RepID=A0A9P4QAZ2_9PEZI|nr:TBC-domain-containing protein [Polychaeton citri CBS 116435]